MCYNSISSFMTLILWMENWLVSCAEEVFKRMKKVSNFYAATITFATSTTSTHCSKPSGVLRVTHFSQRRRIWKNIWLLVVIVLNIFTQRRFTNWEKRFLKSWMHSTSHIEGSENCSRTWQYLTLSPFVSRKQTHTNKQTTTWIGKHGPIAVCISSNLIPEPIFLCNANPHHLVSSFITALEGLATQSNAQMKLNFIEVETAIKIKLRAILEQFNHRRNWAERVSNFVDDCIVEEDEKDLSTQFLQMQKNQLIDLQEHFERYCNVLQQIYNSNGLYAHKSYISNNFKAAISEYKGVLHCDGYDYEQDPEDISNPLRDPFFTRRMKLLSRPDGFMLYGKLGIDFFSTSELLYPNMKIRLRLIRARPNFYMISDNPNVSLGIVDCSLYTRRIALKDDFHKKKWTCSLMPLWNTITWRLWQRHSSYLRDKTNSFKKTFSTMLPFVESRLQCTQTLPSLFFYWKPILVSKNWSQTN